jgi:hypothetical protein
MDLDLSTTHGWIKEELAANREVTVSMNSIIDRCENAFPHDDWKDLRQLAYGDLGSLPAWIEKPFRMEPPPEPLRGLWFGLFNPYEGATPVADMYVCGSKRFEPDEDDCDWATGPEWWPRNRYAKSKRLAAIYRVAYRAGGLANNAEYPLCLGYAAFVVRDLLNRIDPKLVLDSVGTVGVAVGFDSGDFLLLGRFTHDGLVPI